MGDWNLLKGKLDRFAGEIWFRIGFGMEYGIHGRASRRRAIKKKKKKLLPIGRRRLASLRPCPASHVIMSESRSRDGMTYFSFTLLCILCLCLLLFLFSPFVLFLFYISRSRENETRIFVGRKASVSFRSNDDAPGDWHLQTWSKPFTVLQLTRDPIAGMIIPIDLSDDSFFLFFLFWK